VPGAGRLLRGHRGAPDEIRAYLDLRNRILKELGDEGTPIMMGTDSPQLFDVPGFALHREIAVMSEAGMTEQQILDSGTATVGRYVKITHSFGTVTVGQHADLILLGSNPLDDLDNLNDRVGVMIRGRWVPKAEIDSGLAALAAKHPRQN
jgi:imidazolonepropionase-like amidohydrolase